jgi:2-hydroxy-3-oxopropionate reductase
MTKPTLGFIGLGIMGKPMAHNLLAAGYPLIVHNRSQAAVVELIQAGAAKAGSPREIAERSEVVITMLPDSSDVELVATGPEGIVDGAKAGLIYVDMSTIAPAVAVHVAEVLAEKGVRCLDAPVSGGDIGAQKGTLSIMAGGDEVTFAEVKPIFDVLGTSTVLCGPNGAGQTVKACNQVLVAVTIAGVSEALALGAKAGVDPAKIVQVLGGGLARCGVLENRGQRMVRGDFEPGFRIRLHYKDLNIIRQTSKDYGVPLPATAAVHELFATAMAWERGDLDHTGLLTVVEDLAGIQARTGTSVKA